MAADDEDDVLDEFYYSKFRFTILAQVPYTRTLESEKNPSLMVFDPDVGLKAFPPLYRGDKAGLTGCISKATKRKMPEPRYINPTIPTPTDKDEMPDLMFVFLYQEKKGEGSICDSDLPCLGYRATYDRRLASVCSLYQLKPGEINLLPKFPHWMGKRGVGEKAREIDAAMGQYETGFLALLQHLSLSASHLAWWPDVKKAIQVQNDKLDEQDVEDRNIAYLARVEKAALRKGEEAIKKVENARENLAQRTASRRERKVKARKAQRAKAQAEEQRTKSDVTQPPSSPAANHATVQPPGSSPVRKPSPGPAGQAAAQPLAHVASGEVSSGEGAGKESNKAQAKDGATGEETDWYKTVIGRPL